MLTGSYMESNYCDQPQFLILKHKTEIELVRALLKINPCVDFPSPTPYVIDYPNSGRKYFTKTELHKKFRELLEDEIDKLTKMSAKKSDVLEKYTLAANSTQNFMEYGMTATALLIEERLRKDIYRAEIKLDELNKELDIINLIYFL